VGYDQKMLSDIVASYFVLEMCLSIIAQGISYLLCVRAFHTCGHTYVLDQVTFLNNSEVVPIGPKQSLDSKCS
jgi:hypothetical protein